MKFKKSTVFYGGKQIPRRCVGRGCFFYTYKELFRYRDTKKVIADYKRMGRKRMERWWGKNEDC